MRTTFGITATVSGLAAWVYVAAFTVVLLAGVPSHAAEQVKQDAAAEFPVYKPPRRGAPLARVGGGTRGERRDAPQVYVLTPEHAGLTAQAQPVLYWYLTRAVQTRFEFVLISEGGQEPLVETTLAGIDSSGIQRISLADHGITLQPGVSYQWSVAAVIDAEHRSGDILASGMIERVEPPAGIMIRAANAQGEERIARYAEAGLWYDALQSLDEQIAASPSDARLPQVRAALLGQVGLDDVASALKEP